VESTSIFVERLSLGGDGAHVAVKDTIDVAGVPTRAGSRAFADAPPAECNAAVVDALLAAGCRIVGKTNLHEFAYGVTGINDYTGTPLNSRFPDRVPGGSSSGSAAAVAAGLVAFALGTDTGGSIRVPAACCGVVGLKPTFGRVSRAGVMPAISSLDCVGPFARDVATIEKAMSILDPHFATTTRGSDPMVGVPMLEMDNAVRAAFDAALRAAPIRHVPVTLAGMLDAFAAGIAIIGAETWAALGSYATSEAIGEDVRARLLAAQQITPDDIAGAERIRANFTAEVDALLERVDALVLPTMPEPTLGLDAGRDARAALRVTQFVRPFNLSGHPAISVPLPARDGYSVGLQLVGRRGADADLCALAHAFETA